MPGNYFKGFLCGEGIVIYFQGLNHPIIRLVWLDRGRFFCFINQFTVRLVDQPTNIMIGCLITIGLTQRSVVRGCPITRRSRRLHHAERGVRTHVVVYRFSTAAHTRHHLVRGIVSLHQRGRRVFDLFVGLVTGLPFDRTTISPTWVLCTVFFPVQVKNIMV